MDGKPHAEFFRKRQDLVEEAEKVRSQSVRGDVGVARKNAFQARDVVPVERPRQTRHDRG